MPNFWQFCKKDSLGPKKVGFKWTEEKEIGFLEELFGLL